ncbi:DeoR/GlpR family DNA-binding transcription regulator [Clostridium lacusfryxellense]|uniref:DeoR/GlpR family DNA-binding transcription regulator n=1 Tax=Clostridium lacusfryxellense TaxID=205328 RepID=UPI001C0D676A|nr:DeoR/GlpR family DNA-binding transcription regulator [Clostridium lacusfryxellense]MBU3113756.1 DeoR/GlpR family DNA-binding transcription regulator [Clostridium lacusfryxellense]
MNKRHTKLLEIVNKEGRIEVTLLSSSLEVSQVTIRKDLALLEEKGFLKREHGFAVMVSSDDISNRLAFNYDVKSKIAIEAAKIVENGETVMIESGSCCALLAKELATNKRDVTIITNSAFIASYIRECPFAKIVLLGGDYQAESQVVVGPIARKCIDNFYVDKLFVGTDGFTAKLGFTGKNHMRTEIARAMAENANKVIVLTESTKFSKQGVAFQFNTKEVAMIVTDSKIPGEITNLLVKDNIDVKMV